MHSTQYSKPVYREQTYPQGVMIEIRRSRTNQQVAWEEAEPDKEMIPIAAPHDRINSSQIHQASSTLHDATNSNIREQLASFQAVQLQQFSSLGRKLEESGVDLKNVSKLADHLFDEGLYQSKKLGGKRLQ